jgi:methionine-rich copper-binding protein CopC
MFERKYLRLATAAVAVMLSALPAFAHAHPVTMTPAKDAVIGAPTEVSIVFSEDLEGKFSTLALEDSSGKIVSTAKAVLDPANARHLTLALPKLPQGAYTVDWTSVATDGHRLSGKYTFTVK